MLIVGLNGSPNKKGNTAYLINRALEAIKGNEVDTELIHVQDALKGLNIPFCTVCSNPCEGKCYKGKPLEKAYETLKKADGILIGSPVYFGAPSGQLKAFWDMTRKLRKEKALINTVGGVITVGAAPHGGQETTGRAIMDMMLIQGMIIVGDGCSDSDAGHFGAMAQKPSDQNTRAMERAVILAKRVVEVAKAIKNYC